MGILKRLLSGVALLCLVLSVDAHASSAPPADKAGTVKSDFLELPPITLPVIKDGKIVQQVGLLVVVEVDDDGDMMKITEQIPKLLDAYNSALYGRLDQSYLGETGLIDVNKVRARMIQAHEEIFPGKIKTLLIKSVSQRR